MAACMLPTVAFAADTGKAIQLGTDALSKKVKPNRHEQEGKRT